MEGGVQETDANQTENNVEKKTGPSATFMEICNEFDENMDADLLDRSWKQYDTVGQQCVLEGNEKAWIACAIYLSMWQSAPIGQGLSHKYSLMSLIRVCKISVLEFFEKLAKWVEMIGSPRRLQDQVSRIQCSLALSAVVYKKFLPIFRKLFAAPESDADQMRKDCKKIFDLCWALFITLKKLFTTDDLIRSFHLLLCCVDVVFQDIRHSGRKNLLNFEFVSSLNEDSESILETLCRKFEGVVLDAKHFRTHWWLPQINKMIEEQHLIVSSDLRSVFANAETNISKLSEFYEEQLIKKGEMDERMFIPKDISTVFDETFDESAVEQLRRSELGENWDVDAELLLRMSTQSCLEKVNEQRAQQTPLSGRSYIISGEQANFTSTPISASTCNALKMESLLRKDWQMANSELERIMSESRENPSVFVKNYVRAMGSKLESAVEAETREKGPTYDERFSEMISTRRAITESLFYRLLEKIAIAERQRLPTNECFDLSMVLNKEELLTSVYACALELVLFTYKSEREFPWSIDVLRIAPVNFYKVIELVIRAEPELSREMVKHLNRVEERVLEELAWSFGSPLWQTLARRADGVPSSQSVSLNAVEAYSARTQSMYGLSQRYNTPLKLQTGVARRKLEFDDDDGPPVAKRAALESENMASTSATTLFFRKVSNSLNFPKQVLPYIYVYYLAVVRLQDLCERVRLDERGRQTVWTLFEHVLRTETSLMAGRHLDQNLMCCLYVVAKIGKQDVSFHDIMSHYRHQPQASSRVYRCVLIERNASPTTVSDDNASRDSVGSNSGGKFRSGSALPVPGTGSAPPTPEPQNLDYSDIIRYYNQVFVSRVEYFLKKLQPGPTDIENGVNLLPMPSVQYRTLSPRRSITDRVCVHPMPSSAFPASPSRPFRYCFNRSPVQELRAINSAVHSGRSASYSYSGSYSPYGIRQSQHSGRAVLQ
uniref:Retinoblastoma-like protein 1 n=1 Tax=Syphacia muris TaxID=451379 RepID=A0A0N5AMP1_9BILA